MIFLTTGQPGAGKTLYTLGLVEEFRKQTGRKVFYFGVDELTLDWTALDEDIVHDGVLYPGENRSPKGWVVEWDKIPDGAIVFVDECWKIFPVRKQGSQVPPHVAFLATHRHRAFDIYLVTQDRQQVDTFVRKLVGRHYHVSRKFGFERVTIYQWEAVRDPTSEKDQKEALTTRWDYDKSRFAWYRSAFAHTARKDFPKKMIAYLLGGFLLLGGLVYMGISRVRSSAKIPTAVAQRTSGASVAGRVGALINPWSSEYRSPRIRGRADSAKLYDAVSSKVQSAPRPVGCFQLVFGDGRIVCSCQTSQGTDANVTQLQCLEALKVGIFDPSKNVDAKAENIAYLNSRDAQASSGVSSGSSDSLGLTKPGVSGGSSTTGF